MNSFEFHPGSTALLISMPHAGTVIPPEIGAQMLPVAQLKADTDWHLPQLYHMAQALGASTLSANYSRYVIDLNRAPDDANLYPGQDTTGLCPVDTFDKQALYAKENLPDEREAAQRIATYWQPYHRQLQAELARLLALHGRVVLWEAHSIASQVPRFFAGTLADLNFGTVDQQSCAAGLQQALATCLEQDGRYSHVFNGRFKGGYITRQYGQPQKGIHAVQLEMSQCVYMNETAPFAYRPDLAAQVQPLLGRLLRASLDWVGA
ncbi:MULTISPECIES: N-formylglutamate deformylase [unclassified Undibacterium]|uniref:N-formylglutamate deformylase n=1 Tax=unclassified Undibacterium TaxID=2630295 RepID=UPI002AC92F8D|nr:MULTISPECIES: N-formylglutamate deformylase [unclassified Undibacterium]MEB0137432.1 N-formylglutamate deformylase [Undibacterium sp. CCC2.1]MEB0170903.1 N-formylglutamate deformylase [Undibacterium sp. CCC1.1]MEB0174855.1 N-formylglutamate deformylase [Undibacterium sp. CCC3.4]MEB0214191.1 N-formylglutamate deformylase [Undibacterium sp. 5I2]WPX44502.1 N-formylglutamate deformylase [Undibacterium sp. CCC3.4]